MEQVRIGVIGGSGVYNMEGLDDVKEVSIDTPFGDPSDAFIIGTLEGEKVAFLARHGRGHRLLPTEVNSKANIYAFKKLGVEMLISISACGSLREDFAPRHIVIPDQLFDRTRSRPLTFFGGGIVAHISFDRPFCPCLSEKLHEAVRATGATVHKGGTFVVIEGPRFSTKAESNAFRQQDFDIIGMTAIPEAQMAREAEICYATMAHVTDYDVWHETEEPVTIDMVVANLQANAGIAKQAIKNLVPMLREHGTDCECCGCARALQAAIFTDPAVIPERVKKELGLLVGKYI